MLALNSKAHPAGCCPSLEGCLRGCLRQLAQGRRGVGEKKLFPALTAPQKIAKNGGAMYPYPTTLP